MSRMLRRAMVVLGLLVVAVGSLVSVGVAVAEPRPELVAGPAADALLARVAEASGAEGWDRTGAVRFRVFGRAYLWDRERNLVRYEDGRGVVLTEGWRPMGRAFRDGVEVGGRWKDRRVQTAYERFVNDSFWVFGNLKVLRDDVVVGTVAGEPDALVTRYDAGGVTPGDLYLWEIGPDGRPVAFRMWTRALPWPGVRVQWTEWAQLPTTAWVARRRGSARFGFDVEELVGAEHLADLAPGEDPFAPMFR